MLFPYFGAKSKAAPLVWDLLGDPELYVEPFAGSLAVLFNRPKPEPENKPRTEIAVDLDGLLVNFWRTIQKDWRAMEPYLSLAVSEVDVRAKHAALINARSALTEKLDDPNYYDPELAAWWWEGISSWLGSGYGWKNSRQRPHIDRSLKGAWAKGMTDTKLNEAADRLGNVIILSGDWQDAWKRSVTEAIINRFDKSVGVFLDPPYMGDRAKGLYAEDLHLNEEVSDWCLRQPRHVKIVLAGYATEYPALLKAGWEAIEWKAPNGYAGKTNSRRQAESLLVRRKRVVSRGATPVPN